jgi:1,2-diacylglycerol 3-alpha-glucosyltransferase
MLSIALFSECYHPIRNGVVVSVASFARTLAGLGHDVTIFTTRHPEQPEDQERVIRFPAILSPTGARYPLALPIPPRAAHAELSARRFDLIHSNSPMLMGQVALWYHRRHRIPLVFTYHTLIEEYTHYIPLPAPLVRWGAIRVSRDYSNAVDHIVTPGLHVADRLRRYAVTQPITVIPTGIDLDFIVDVPAADIRTRYGIPDRVPLLVSVGRVAREKNLTRLVSAFRCVLDRTPDAHLLLVGGGPFEAAIRDQVQALNMAAQVHLTGFVTRDEVVQSLRAADLFVFTSRTETQGLVLGEAMACGLPVVAVSSEAAGEVVADGVEGFLVPDGDGPLAEAILTILGDANLRTAMCGFAGQRADGLSAQHSTERLLAVYQQVLAR